MKKVALIISVFGILALLIFQIIKVANSNEIQTRDRIIAELPEVYFQTLNGENVLIPKSGAHEKLLVFYNSDCEYCQEKARIFSDKKDQSRNIDVYWISSEPLEKILSFIDEYNLSSQNFYFFEDRDGASYTHYLVKTTPTIFHYDKSGKFIQEFPNDAPVGYIFDKINNVARE
uniref:peroxiredoxin family protein n=2 Tax=Roseivirga sp. TaxID=1964215 RepID=UPI004048337D